MKKLLNKIRRKQPEEEASRITADTIAEHRERVLAGGRRFKYPLQTARHRLVILAIIIGVAALVISGLVGWWQLYIVQNTSDFMYRVTKVIPLPVASVDGQQVRYSDYLMKYRSAVHYLEEKEQINLNTEDGRRQSDFIKQQSIQDAIADAYALKIAKQNDITVSDAELETFLKQQRTSSDGEVSESTYDAVILDYYGWSPEEYRHAMRSKLLRQKVAYAVDAAAQKTSEDVANAVKGSADLKAVAESINATGTVLTSFGGSGWVAKTNQDGGLATAATALAKGAVSATAIKTTSGDGYYFIKLVDINDTQVNYEFIHIPLSVFVTDLAGLTDSDKVAEYINVPDASATQ